MIDIDAYTSEIAWPVPFEGDLTPRKIIGIFTQRTIHDMITNGTRHWRVNHQRMIEAGITHIVFFRNKKDCLVDDVPHGHIFGAGKISAMREYPPLPNHHQDVRKGFMMDEFADFHAVAEWGFRSPVLYGTTAPLPPTLKLNLLPFKPVGAPSIPTGQEALRAIQASYKAMVEHFGENGPPATSSFFDAFQKAHKCLGGVVWVDRSNVIPAPETT